MGIEIFGRNRDKTFPEWCDTGSSSYAGLRHTLDKDNVVVWNVKDDKNLPHYDHIEMSGFFTSGIISYGVDGSGKLKINRHIIYPSLRMIPNETNGSLTHNFPEGISNFIYIDNQLILEEYPWEIEIDGVLKIKSLTNSGVSIKRTLFPAMFNKAFMERIDIQNITDTDVNIRIKQLDYYFKTLKKESLEGSYLLKATLKGDVDKQLLTRNEILTLYVIYTAQKKGEEDIMCGIDEEISRKTFLDKIDNELILITPDNNIDTAFKMAKRRCSESIFETKCGLMHAPGGGDYYAALWTNDQCEYVNPLFPLLGYKKGIEQSINSYKLFMNYMKEDFSTPLVSSIVAEGDDYWAGAGDRGDAAMFAYGALRFVLSHGSREVVMELLPGIKWAIEYSLRKINSDGVVESDSDELENRFESGDANLFTSCLLYDALISMVSIVNDLNLENEDSDFYVQKAEKLADSIENYFGGNVEGYETYKYYKGNSVLRSWICMPLVVGLNSRSEGTIEALFSSRLWTKNGLKTHADEETFWDRSTLFALRGVFSAGYSDLALEYLEAYTKQRLLGEHVPYPVEAYPEGNQRHLAAESGLYVRIITEGLLGIRPTGLKSFDIKPQLPSSWPELKLNNIHLCQNVLNIELKRENGHIRIIVSDTKNIVFNKTTENSEIFTVKLN